MVSTWRQSNLAIFTLKTIEKEKEKEKDVISCFVKQAQNLGAILDR